VTLYTPFHRRVSNLSTQTLNSKYQGDILEQNKVFPLVYWEMLTRLTTTTSYNILAITSAFARRMHRSRLLIRLDSLYCGRYNSPYQIIFSTFFNKPKHTLLSTNTLYPVHHRIPASFLKISSHCVLSAGVWFQGSSLQTVSRMSSSKCKHLLIIQQASSLMSQFLVGRNMADWVIRRHGGFHPSLHLAGKPWNVIWVI
jgi:hypothetical protein